MIQAGVFEQFPVLVTAVMAAALYAPQGVELIGTGNE